MIVPTLALVAAVFALTETLPFARAKAAHSKAHALAAISTNPGSAEMFALVT